MVAKMGESFDPLVMAAEASKATYEDQVCMVSTLRATNADLRNSNLVDVRNFNYFYLFSLIFIVPNF